MELAAGDVTPGGGVGESPLRRKWRVSPKGGRSEYDDFLESLLENIFESNSAIKLGGDVTFELVPRASKGFERLISAETAFFFHQDQERRGYANDYHPAMMHKDHKLKAISKYNEPAIMENFMPEI